MSDSSKTGGIYASFMQEIKWRLTVAGGKLEAIKKAPGTDIEREILDTEFSYLQTRFVCELTALSALAAHHSYGLKKALLDQWHADQIFAELENINPHCFPVPISLGRKDGGLHFDRHPERAITRQQLKEIYGRCGENLHRGFLRHALAGKNKLYNVDHLWGWIHQLQTMLNEHLILLPNEERVLIVSMTGRPDGQVTVIQAQAEGPYQGPPPPQSNQQKPRRPRKGS